MATIERLNERANVYASRETEGVERIAPPGFELSYSLFIAAKKAYERGFTDAMQQRTAVTTDAMLRLVVERCEPMLTLAEALSVIVAYERVRGSNMASSWNTSYTSDLRRREVVKAALKPFMSARSLGFIEDAVTAVLNALRESDETQA